METIFKIIFAVALASPLLALLLQPIWQERREKKLAEEMKALRKAGNAAAAGAVVDEAMRDNLEIAERMKGLRRGG